MTSVSAAPSSTSGKTYPRPQLRRPEWVSLDGPWQFCYDDDDRGRQQGWSAPESDHDFDRTIEVPFVPESRASGIGDAGFHPSVWYRRTLALTRPDAASGLRHILHFGAVDHRASVWVDGQLVTTHVGGQTAFFADITDALVDGDQHVLVVRAYDDPQSLEQPRGKQDWELEPHGIWYQRSTGIWRSVWLETRHRHHVAGLHWDSDLTSGTVSGTVFLADAPPPDTTLSIRLFLEGQTLARLRVGATSAQTAFSVQLPALGNEHARQHYWWSPEHPTLIDAEVSLSVAETEVDSVTSYLGIRSTTVEGGFFALNGRPCYVRSVLEQGYWSSSHFTAPSDEAVRAEVELILALGFNAARVHQQVADPRFLYEADRQGLMVWGETAAALEFSVGAVELLTNEWLAVVEQCRNHPSIVTWVPFNESWGVQDLATVPAQRDYVQGLTSLTRALDPTRPVVSNDGWEHVDSDILALHDYASDPAELKARYGSTDAVAASVSGFAAHFRRAMLTAQQRQKFADGRAPLMITEFGGISYADRSGTWGYTLVDSDEAYRERLTGLFAALQAAPTVAGFCYTQLTDTLQEANGLCTEDRQPKLAVETLRSIIRGGVDQR